MASHGIKDQVAIIGMGCTQFKEHWDRSADDLMIDAVGDTLASAGVAKDDIDAWWLGTAQSGMSGVTLAAPLKLDNKPVTRVENYCATGSEALRQACYAVASGAYDMAAAVGVEKVKDSGYQGLNAFPIPTDGTQRSVTAAAMFSLVAPAYAQKYGIDPQELRRTLARIASKNHANGAKNERAQFRREMSVDAICKMPEVAGMLSVFDCAGVADGAAAAIVVRAEDAHRYCENPLYVKALAMVAGNGGGLADPDFDYTHLTECEAAGRDAYAQAGITDPRRELAMAEVHDCFTPTELVLMEDLGFSARGEAWRDIEAGAFDLHGDLPVNTDGGLKSFRPPGRRLGPADALRVLAPAAWRGARRSPDRHRGPWARADPQPGWLPR
jgi:acetyl-CoA C-acetyltransferase